MIILKYWNTEIVCTTTLLQQQLHLAQHKAARAIAGSDSSYGPGELQFCTQPCITLPAPSQPRTASCQPNSAHWASTHGFPECTGSGTFIFTPLSLFAVLSIESSMISQFLILLILLGVIQNCLSSEQVINVGDQISTSHNFNFTEREPSPLWISSLKFLFENLSKV